MGHDEKIESVKKLIVRNLAQLGEATSDLVGFYDQAATDQHIATADVTGFAAGGGTASKSDSQWSGSTGITGYTVGDIITCLKEKGLMKA